MAAFDGTTIKVSISPAQLAYVEQTLGAIKNGADKAISAAINDTLRWGRTRLVRMMGDVLNLRATDIRDRINIKQRASGSSLEGILSLDYKQVPLIDFRARFSRSRGVTVTTIKDEPALVFKHRFKATMNSGHQGIFEREYGAAKVVPTSGSYAGRTIKRGPRKGQYIKRQPIKEAFGVSVLRAFEIIPDLQEQALGEIEDKFQERLTSKIEWQLSRAQASVPETV